MNEPRLPDYLEHMRQAASDARIFVDGLTKSEFLADKRTQQAVIMSLVIVGEAATKAMDRHPEFADRHPEIPWRSIRGMRNRIAHGYFDINLESCGTRCKRHCYASWSNCATLTPLSDVETSLRQTRRPRHLRAVLQKLDSPVASAKR